MFQAAILLTSFVLVGVATAQSAEFTNQITNIKVDEKKVAARRSPDGDRILYSRWKDGKSCVFKARSDGSGEVQLTDATTHDSQPCWSADGEFVLFESRRTGTSQIFKMDLDGNNVEQLTDEQNGARRPLCSATGWMAWEVMRQKDLKVWRNDLVIEKDGVRKTITSEPDYIGDFAWQPNGEAICFGTINKLTFYSIESDSSQVISLKEKNEKFYSHVPAEITWAAEANEVACRIPFLGGRMAGGGAIFGDEQVFRISPDSFEMIEGADLQSYPVDWIREFFVERE